MRDLSRQESDRRASAGESFALRFRVPRELAGSVQFTDAVYGAQSKAYVDLEISLFCAATACQPITWPTAPMMPTCASATLFAARSIFRRLQAPAIFDAAGVEAPTFAHLPLLMAPDGMKLSKRVHGPVVSVTTYRDAGFLPQAFVNFLCLLVVAEERSRDAVS